MPGPLWLDPLQTAKFQDSFLVRYRKSIRLFLEFLRTNNFQVRSVGELDDLLVDYKNASAVSKSLFEATVAAAELCWPPAKGNLPWARAVLSAWAVVHVPHHAVVVEDSHAAEKVATDAGHDLGALAGRGLRERHLRAGAVAVRLGRRDRACAGENGQRYAHRGAHGVLVA